MTHALARWKLSQSAQALACAAVALGLCCSCANTKKTDDSASAAPSASAMAPAALPSPSASATAQTSPAPSAAADPMASMFGNMAKEAANRPGVHPSVDDGFAALAKAGVGVKDPKQSIGSTYKASYCSHGLIASKDLSVLLCEYVDAEHAAAGLAESKRLFVGLATRETMANKTLLLVTIFQDEKHPASTTAAQQKVVSTFKAL